MPKKAKELKAIQVKRLVEKPDIGFHSVGGVAGLALQIRGDSAASWILRTKIGGKRRDIGLGGYSDVTLALAIKYAREVKDKIKQGVDPVAEKKANKSALIRAQAKVITFEAVAKEFVIKKSQEFKTTKQVQRLEYQLANYVYPYIGQLVIADIERAHIEQMLTPIWTTKHETASRVRMCVERILDLAGAKGLRSGDNPARWKGNLDLSLVAPSKASKVVHLSALSVDDMPKFMKELTVQEWRGAKALEFIILTAARSGEVRASTWNEIDLKEKVWTIGSDRMKSGKQHVIPLSDGAVRLLESIPKEGKHIFTGPRGGVISDVSVSKTPKLLGHEVTAHGFRSTFKDWARKHTAYADEVTELALAHVNSDQTRAAYARDGLLDKRRLLMSDWEQYCYHGHPVSEGSTVVNIGGRK